MKVESFSREKYHLQGLEPGTAYEFQVSCRILPGRGLWSDWSSTCSHTPAAGEESPCPNPPASHGKIQLRRKICCWVVLCPTLDPDLEAREGSFCKEIAFF